jgi:hypothetical protein
MKKVKAFFYLVTLICTWAYISLIRIIGYSFSEIDLSANIKSPNLVLVNLTNIILCVLVFFVIAVVNYWAFELMDYFKLKDFEKATEEIAENLSEKLKQFEEEMPFKQSPINNKTDNLEEHFSTILQPIINKYEDVNFLLGKTKDPKISVRTLAPKSFWYQYSNKFVCIGYERSVTHDVYKILVDYYGRIFIGKDEDVNDYVLFYWPTIEKLVSASERF